jgi:hypothetical protein
MLEEFKTLLNKDITDDLANIYIGKAVTKFKNYCHRIDVPQVAESSIVDYAFVLYNRQGSEGLSAESYSGVSNTYETGIPQVIKDEWVTFRKVQTL